MRTTTRRSASGNRAALLAAAGDCLRDKGYARSTARDIATAAGVSLAAIGYHFGSKEALLDEALVVALKDWGDELQSLGDVDAGASPRERFSTVWDRVLASVRRDRSLWAVQFELLADAGRDPERAAALAAANGHARAALAELFGLPSAHGDLLQMLILGAASRLLLDPDDVIDAPYVLARVGSLLGDVGDAER